MLHSRLCAAERRRGRPGLRWRDLPPDGPQECSHFAGNRSHDDRKLLACRVEPAIMGAKADLRLPGDVAHGLRQSFEPGSQGARSLASDSDRSRLPRPAPAARAGCPLDVRPFRRMVSPVELSAGTRPRKDISCLGVSNRRTSPISAAKVTATRNDAPRIA